ncbi:hypothetical protein [Halobacillus sp. B23F22_1]|uniref:hypothetical protein n=1 Tax=Halobacillus sp. B23F22_1 TaxID=3459514 RepID=UPI00373F4B3C
MAADCQFCGTSVLLSNTGAFIVNKQREQAAIHLPVHYEDQAQIIHNYHSNAQLLASLHIIFQKSTPCVWIHILNKVHSQSFPISKNHDISCTSTGRAN